MTTEFGQGDVVGGHDATLVSGSSGFPSGQAGGLVGRERERRLLGWLMESLDAVGGGLTLVGEAGIGKTALLEHVATLASARPAIRALWVRGEESEAVLAFAAAADLLLPLREHAPAEVPIFRSGVCEQGAGGSSRLSAREQDEGRSEGMT